MTDKKKDAENATDKERGLQKMNENKTGKIAGIEGQKEMGNEIKDINENIAAQVQKRIDQEKAELGEPDGSTPGPPKIDDAFIKQCLFENEHGDGMLYSRMFAGKFLYAKVLKEWLVFAGHHLDIDFMDDSVSAVEDVTKTYKQEALKTMNKIKQMEKDRETKEDIESVEGYLKSLNGRVQRLYSDRGRTNCLKHAHTIKTLLAIKRDEIDQEPYLLAVKNGVVDLKSGELRDGQIDDYLMKSSPVEFKGTDAPCVEWKKFLLNVFEDKDGNEQPAMVEFLQRLFGYVLIGNVSEHIFVMLSGEGRNGKGTIMAVVEYILGSLAGTVQSEMLLGQKMERSAAAVSPDIMNLRGLRLANASETDDGRRFAGSKVKWLSGGDMLQGRWPYDKRLTDFLPTHTLFLQTNHPPHADSSDKPFWERLILIEFQWSYVTNPKNKKKERKRDIKLRDRLIAEASGILGWMVEGSLLYQGHGLMIPDEVIEAGKKYRKNEDDMGDWIEQNCFLDEETVTTSTELFDDFKPWYVDNVSKTYQWSHRRFTLSLMKSRPELHKYKEDGKIRFRGIGIKNK